MIYMQVGSVLQNFYQNHTKELTRLSTNNESYAIKKMATQQKKIETLHTVKTMKNVTQASHKSFTKIYNAKTTAKTLQCINHYETMIPIRGTFIRTNKRYIKNMM